MMLAGSLAGLAGCGEEPVKPPGQRTYANPESGYRYIAPPLWKVMRGEVRSPRGTLVTIKVLPLVNADDTWLAGLPGSLLPQLEQWARYFFRVVEKPTQKPATIGGLAALEAAYPVKVRPSDPPSQISFWVVRRGENLYLVRAVFPGGSVATDYAGVTELLASWQFFDASGVGGQDATGGFVFAVPTKPVSNAPR